MMNEGPEKELLAVAKLGAPRGLKGLLKVHSFSGDYSHIESLKEVLVAPDGEPAQGRFLRVSLAERGERSLDMAFSGYESPEKAKGLTGMLLYLPRELASPLGKTSFISMTLWACGFWAGAWSWVSSKLCWKVGPIPFWKCARQEPEQGR